LLASAVNEPITANTGDGTIQVLTRESFLRRFAKTYGPGQHVTFLGPTQRGKTFLSHQMLDAVIRPDFKCLILSGKPPKRDSTMTKAAKQLNLRVVDEWPPEYRYGDRHRNGFVLRPKHNMKDDDTDELNMTRQFRRGLTWAYRSPKPLIVVADEAFQLQNELKLQKQFERILVRGAPVVAMWTLLQRGRFSSYFVYDQAEHLLIAKDDDMSNVSRYAELFGGLDKKFIMATVASLKTKSVPTPNGSSVTISEFLYVRRAGPEMYVIGMD
jgi:hypothetical protein